MAEVGSALRTKLLTYSAISSLVGTRIYPDALLQGCAFPAVVYTKISTEREHAMSDVSRLSHARIQFDCYDDKGSGRTQSNAVAQAIQKSGICAYRGTTDGIAFQAIQIDSGDSYAVEPPSDGNQEHRYITTFDLRISYLESE
jgi:hypothetical protein